MPYVPDGSKPYYLRLRINLLSGFGYRYKGIYKTIDVLSTTTLEELHRIIFFLFERYDEHMWEFHFGASSPMSRSGLHICSDGEMEADWLDGMGDEEEERKDCRLYTLEDLHIAPRQHFFYIFDYGDMWEHKIVVSSYQEVKEADPDTFRLVKSVGQVPPQYPDFDDEDDEDEDEE